MPQEKKSGGKEIDFEKTARELCAGQARAHNAAGADILGDLAESLDLLANVAIFYIKKKGLRDGDFTEDEFYEEFGE